VLQRPEIPRHTNGLENDIWACVTKRKISGGTMSTAGCTARDVMLGLMRTCNKLGSSFFRYLGDHLHVPGVITILPLPDTWLFRTLRGSCRSQNAPSQQVEAGPAIALPR